MPALSLPHKSKQKRKEFRQEAGSRVGPGELSYLSGLARRQVKRHSRTKASARRRRLRTPVRTMSRVGVRRAILR